MNLWDLTIVCNMCGYVDYTEELYIVPGKGKFLCKACSLKEEEQVIPMNEIDSGSEKEEE